MKSLSILLILCIGLLYSQSYEEYNCCDEGVEGGNKVPLSTSREGGLFKPAYDTLKVLIIWAEFKDDNLSNNDWDAGQEPDFMGTVIDTSWDGSPTVGTLTDYFDKASCEGFKLIGNEVHVESFRTRQYYLDNNKRYYDCNRDILQKLDSTFYFQPYDKWDFNGLSTTPRFSKTSDGKVDFVFIVWRNINIDLKSAMDDLNFNHYARIGATVSVDGGSRTIQGGNIWAEGSGVTIMNAVAINYKGKMIHELAHYFLGGNSWHSGFGFWSMLDQWGARSNCPTAYERRVLEWIPAGARSYDINTSNQTSPTYTLRDFMQYGDNIRIEIDGTNKEYFFVENHQRNYSTWDNPDKSDTSVKGLYIWHLEEGEPEWKNWLCPADGKFSWTYEDTLENPWREEPMPSWRRSSPDAGGYSDCDTLTWTYVGEEKHEPIWYWYNDEDKRDVTDMVKFYGDGKDQFDESNRIFSPWALMNSNDKDGSSTGIAVEVVDVETSGNIQVKVYVNTGINARPSNSYMYPIENDTGKPGIDWHENSETDIWRHYLYRSTSLGGSYSYVTSTASGTSYYRDSGAPSAPSTGYLYYRINTLDNSYKSSGSTYRKYDVPPSAPGNFALTTHPQGSTYRPKLTWTACAEDDIAGYRIFRKIQGESVFTEINEVSAATTSYIDMMIIISSAWWDNDYEAHYYVQSFDDDTNDDELTANTGTLSIDYLIDLNYENEDGSGNIVELPTEFSLFTNYPNPFNPTTFIKFAVPETGNVRISVYNTSGQLVKELANREYGVGYHKIEFDASHLSSGVYFYRMEAPGYNNIKKMLLVK